MKNIKIEIKWALIFIAMQLTWMLLERLAGLHDKNIDKHSIYSNFIMIPAIATYVLALLDKRKKDYNGTMSYKQGFISGLIISIIVTILSPLTQYITSVVITPEFFANSINYAVINSKMTMEAAEKYFNLKNFIIEGLIFAPIMGIFTSAIVAIFTKSKK
jgi:hypothetical protein